MTYNEIGPSRGKRPPYGWLAAAHIPCAAVLILSTAWLASVSGCASSGWLGSKLHNDDDAQVAYPPSGGRSAANKTPIAAYAGVGNAPNINQSPNQSSIQISGAGNGPNGNSAYAPPGGNLPNYRMAGSPSGSAPSGYAQAPNAPQQARPYDAAVSNANSQPYYAAPPQTYSNTNSGGPGNNGGNGNGQPSSAATSNYPSLTQPYYAGPYTTTARMVDPNFVPVGATDVGPAGPNGLPPYGTGGPAPGAPNYGGPNFGGPAPQPPGPWQGQGPVPGQTPGQNVTPGQAPAGATAPGAVVAPSAIVESKDDDEGFDLSHLEPDYTWKELKNLLGWGPDEKLAREAYAAGQAFYRDKNYDDAAKQFYIASWRWPDSLLEEDAMFLEAESYFFADRYAKAQDAYTELLKKHDNTRYMDTAANRLFAIATFWEQLDTQYHHWPLKPNATDKTQPMFDTYGNMLAAYRAVWLNDPTGPLADVSVMRVANSHFRRSEWEDAAYHYGLIRKNHPKSKFQKDAHLLELQCRMRLYQGPRYSASPLSEAEDIANQTLKQFPGQLGEEEARVRQTKAQIIELRAERDWEMAYYYDSKAYYGAAKYYYRDILEHFEHTSFADKTRQRLNEIKGLPDEPPKRFAWLTDLFQHDD